MFMKSAANLLGLHIQGASPGQAFLMEKGERGTGNGQTKETRQTKGTSRRREQGDKKTKETRQTKGTSGQGGQADKGNWGEHLHSVPVFVKYFNSFFGSDSTKKGAVNTAPLY
jgi:hypothetical protein